MIVDNADLIGVAVDPAKYDPPLVVDSNGVKSGQVSSQFLESIGRGYTQIVEPGRDVDCNELSLCPIGEPVKGTNHFVFEQ